MSNETISAPPEQADLSQLLAELEVPFSPEQVQWRVTNTSNDKKRAQVVAYADPRAYTDRLNALFSPQGWTREYRVQTMNNITRMKKGETIVTGKVLVTCTVTIGGLWSHSGTGEEWADDDNGMTSADAQAFKRACSCFGLGRYFYDFKAPWVDLDQHRQPLKTPALPAWAIPDNWRRGMRPPRNNGSGATAPNGTRANGRTNGSGPGAPANQGQPSSTGPAGNGQNHASGNGAPPNGGSNGQNGNGYNGKPAAVDTDSADLDARIQRIEKSVGTTFYRNILREYGRVNQPKLIRDLAVKRKVLQVLESASRGFGRLGAVTKRLDQNTVTALLAKLQAPPLAEIADVRTLQHVVLGLEELAGPNQ